MSITLITGGMFGGKSHTLILKIQRYKIAEKKCIVVKYENDNRYDTAKVVSHNNFSCDCIPVNDKSLVEMENKLLEYDVIGIDEGQFFPSLVVVCTRLANAGKTVLVAGLMTTSMMTAFIPTRDLAVVADDIIHNKAVCVKCFGDASWSYRTDNSNEFECIGADDKYQARCRKCFNGGDLTLTK
jgi:thymidine kinase